MMLLELEEPIVATRDVPDHEPYPWKRSMSVTVQISRRGGSEIPPKHAKVIAMAATVALSRNHLVAKRSAATQPLGIGKWVQQGRALVHGSHQVTRHPASTRMPRLTAQSTSADMHRPKGVRSEAAD